MYKGKIYVLLITLGLVVFTLTNCGDDETLESCAQDEICDGKSVTSCCTVADCVYKYDGKEYPEDEKDQLEDDLGCSGTNARVDAAEEREQLSAKLEALMQEAKAKLE